MHNHSYSIRLFTNWQKDLKAFLIYTSLLMLGRIILITLYHNELSIHANFSSFALCFYRGFQFDARIASSYGLISFLLSLLNITLAQPFLEKCIQTLRLLFLRLFIIITVITITINIGFFAEYHDQFNYWIFGLLFDDFKAIIHTIWQSYPIFWLLLANTIIASLLCIYSARWVNNPFFIPKKTHFLTQITIILLTIMLLIGALRGGFGRRPLQNIDIAITQDSLLNRCVLNPYYAIVFAIYDYQVQQSASALHTIWPHGDIFSALHIIAPDAPQPKTISECIRHKAPGFDHPQPTHLFLIVMESQDSWPFLEAYQDFAINPELRKIAQDGIHISAFVSGSSGTMTSLSTLITGCPYVNIFPNYQSSSSTPYPTAIARLFKSLGYQINFFYGGYLSWQRIEEFCRNQGFDNVYGGSLMGPWENNEWGVDDEFLFNYVLKTVSQDKPSLNIILTTSNHPAYTVDLKKAQCPIHEIPSSLSQYYDEKTPLKIFGHTWYADHCIGQFVKEAKGQYAHPVFAITGDHWSRRFLNSKPTLYESKSVPLILYAPTLSLNNNQPTAGSHIDIIPTLFELCAPENTHYPAFGRNLLNPSTYPNAGCGANTIITPSYIFYLNNTHSPERLPFAPTPSTLSNIETKKLQNYFQALHAASWWMLMQGDNLPNNQ